MASRFLSRIATRLRPPRGFRLTKAGRVFFLLLFALIVIALSTGNNLLFLVLAALLAFMVVSGIQSEVNLRYIELERLIPSEIYAGVPARFGYVLRNTRTRSVRLRLHDVSTVRVSLVDRFETCTTHAHATFGCRGYAELGDISVSTSYPYGLFVKSASFASACRIVVFPRPLPLRTRAVTGDRDEGKGPAQDSISHTRPYVPGDPLSHVVWKKSGHEIVSRVFEGGSGEGGVIVLTPGGDVEAKLSHAAFLANEFSRASRPFGILLGSYFSGLDASARHRIRVLTVLALAEGISAPATEVLPDGVRIVVV